MVAGVKNKGRESRQKISMVDIYKEWPGKGDMTKDLKEVRK